MKTSRSHLCGVALAALIVSVLKAAGVPEEQLARLLESARAQEQKMPPMMMEAVCLTSFGRVGSGLPDEPSERTVTSIRRNGDQIDMIAFRYDRDEQSGQLKPAYESRYIWDGTRFFHRQQPQGKTGPTRPLLCSVSDLEQKRDMLLSKQDAGAFLEGRFWHCGGSEDWIETVERAPVKRLSPDVENVGSIACRVIEVECTHGDYKLWIDAAHGCHIRRATVTVDADDTAWNLPLSKWTDPANPDVACSQIELEVTDVTIENIDGRYLPVEGTYLATVTYSDGSVRRRRQQVKRADVRWNPDFASLGAFVMDFPDEAVVNHREYPIQYRWSNGVLTPLVDAHVVKQLDEISQEVYGDPSSHVRQAMNQTDATAKPNRLEPIPQAMPHVDATRQGANIETPGEKGLLGLAVYAGSSIVCVAIVVATLWLLALRRGNVRKP